MYKRQALKHAGIFHQTDVEIDLIFSGDIDSQEKAAEILGGYEGIIVPSGFGSRGIQGMIEAARYARENKVPYFGIGLGMQTALVEYGRNVLGLDAGSEEAHPDRRDVVVHYARKDTCHGAVSYTHLEVDVTKKDGKVLWAMAIPGGRGADPGGGNGAAGELGDTGAGTDAGAGGPGTGEAGGTGAGGAGTSGPGPAGANSGNTATPGAAGQTNQSGSVARTDSDAARLAMGARKAQTFLEDRDFPEMALTYSPVSYTHLDVYKRQCCP